MKRRAQAVLCLGVLTRGKKKICVERMQLWEWPTLKILCKTRQPTFRQLKTSPPTVQVRLANAASMKAWDTFSTSRFSGQSVPGARKSLLTKSPQPGTESKETGRGKAAKHVLWAGWAGAALQWGAAWHVLPGWIKTEEKPPLPLPRFPTKLPHQCAAIPIC